MMEPRLCLAAAWNCAPALDGSKVTLWVVDPDVSNTLTSVSANLAGTLLSWTDQNGAQSTAFPGGIPHSLYIQGGNNFDVIDLSNLSWPVTPTIHLHRLQICGGAGDDFIDGPPEIGAESQYGLGPVEIYGEDGDDWIVGGAWNEKIFGGDGADILSGNGGADWVYGGLEISNPGGVALDDS
jgi:Ca2+-binding RTX toxin-like protein